MDESMVSLPSVELAAAATTTTTTLCKPCVSSLMSKNEVKNHTFYRCPKCRTILFSETDLISHEINTTTLKNSKKKFQTSSSSSSSSSSLLSMNDSACSSIDLCSVLNVQPKRWMKPKLDQQEISGKLICPYSLKNGHPCQTKLGEYHWEGSTCSCGTWVSPAFFIPKSKVDPIKKK